MQARDDLDRRRSKLPRRLLAALVVVLGLLLALALWRVGPRPRITLEPGMPGIGRNTPVKVGVEEPSRGLSRVTVSLVQGEAATELVRRTYSPRPFWAFWGPRMARDELEVGVGLDAVPDLVEGEATLRVEAARAGTWLRHPRPAVEELTLPVRLTPPSLEILSPQVNVAQGGSEVVVYRVGSAAVRDGVAVGEWFFPGYPLPGGGQGERFCLFGAPYDLEDGSALSLVAEDDVGNRAEASFVDRYAPRPLRHATIELSDEFMARVVPEILSRSREIEDRGDLLANYLAVNGELRRANAARLAELSAGSRPSFLWREPFRQLAGSQVMASFADRRSYLYDGEVVDRQDHLGFDLASRRRAPVEAANRGVVAMAEYFGIYGNTVVVDHGYGLMSLYAHLSGIDVEVGQEVARGQVLGRTGQTGLAGGDHLHFSILVHGLPVNPLEWWDGRWIRDHIGAKLGPALPPAG